MAQTQFCDQGCGRAYFLEIGTAGDPVHGFYCLEHGVGWFLEFMREMESVQAAAEGVEQGTAEEGAEALKGRSRRRGARPRAVAVDDAHGAVVENPPAEDGSTDAPSA